MSIVTSSVAVLSPRPHPARRPTEVALAGFVVFGAGDAVVPEQRTRGDLEAEFFTLTAARALARDAGDTVRQAELEVAIDDVLAAAYGARWDIGANTTR